MAMKKPIPDGMLVCSDCLGSGDAGWDNAAIPCGTCDGKGWVEWPANVMDWRPE